jgi:phosphohistidine phosphatase
VSRRLYVLRHAKSSWDDPGLSDHDRPLAKRGRRATKPLRLYLQKHEIAPELVLCSTARRARETLERIEPALGAPTVRREPALYAASAEALLDRLRDVPDAVTSVMLIGHSPGIEDLADTLTGSPVGSKFPTAALATLELLSARWGDTGPGTAKLIDFVRPRDLER